MNPPTLTGFIAWVRSAMGIDTEILPDDSVWFVYAFNVALDIVDPTWNAVQPNIYTLMVYNLGGNNLINWAQDLPDAPVYPGSGDPGLQFFAWFRKLWNILGPVTGVVESAGDQGTTSGLAVPQALKDLTLYDLQTIKTPWGRTYIAWAQAQGTMWGLT